MEPTLALYLVAVALQALHVLEEFRTGFHRTYPPLIGLKPWSDEFFITLNLAALALFVLIGIGVGYGLRYGTIVVLAFALIMLANGVVHLVLAVRRRGYFPGLYTALAHLVVAVLLLQALRR